MKFFLLTLILTPGAAAIFPPHLLTTPLSADIFFADLRQGSKRRHTLTDGDNPYIIGSYISTQLFFIRPTLLSSFILFKNPGKNGNLFPCKTCFPALALSRLTGNSIV